MKGLLNIGFWFDKDAAGSGGDKGDPAPKIKPKEGDTKDAPTFESWHDSLDDTAKEFLKGHVSGLKTSLKTERDARSEAETAVRDLADKAEKGSKAQEELTEVADSLAEVNKKADFYEIAHEAGVTNIKLAFIVATQDDLISKRGNVDFVKMKESYPELFSRGALKPDGDVGTGSETELGKQASMNTFIRTAAGKK